MYKLEIFDSLEAMGNFLCKKNITDYSFKVFEFNFMGEIKTNVFLSYNK